MKIEFELDCEIKDSIFIQLLQEELKASRDYNKFTHPEDLKIFKRNIKACKQLLDYYGGKYED